MWIIGLSFSVLLNLIMTVRVHGQNVTLTSTLVNRTAFDQERITFKCIASRTQIISWSSTEFIGDGGILQVVFGGNAKAIVISDDNPDTIASRISNTNESIRISELRITASIQYRNVTVTCSNVGDGTSSSISFSTIKRTCTCPTLASVMSTPGTTTIILENKTENNSTGNIQACEVGWIFVTTFVSISIIANMTAAVIWFIRNKLNDKTNHAATVNESTKQKKKNKRKKSNKQHGVTMDTDNRLDPPV